MMFDMPKLVIIAACSLVVGINAMTYDRELFVDHDLLSVSELLSGDAASQRWLGGENNAQYLVYDDDGVAYDPYSLAWRYLGVYIDCTADNDGGNSRDNHRRLGSHSNDNGGCNRKLLWAAYVDPKYEGNYIEEYKFYNIATREWDNSTCLASGEPHRCVNLNCHEPHTKFKLVGVYKETNGLYDWFEQLFKHQGTCIWNDEDVYDTMETWMEKFPSQCTKLSVKDYSGNAIYMCEYVFDYHISQACILCNQSYLIPPPILFYPYSYSSVAGREYDHWHIHRQYLLDIIRRNRLCFIHCDVLRKLL
jgi:hypothetical protein